MIFDKTLFTKLVPWAQTGWKYLAFDFSKLSPSESTSACFNSTYVRIGVDKVWVKALATVLPNLCQNWCEKSLTRRSDLFCSRHVVQTISLYTDRNPLNIHHQTGHNKFDAALRNKSLTQLLQIVLNMNPFWENSDTISNCQAKC